MKPNFSSHKKVKRLGAMAERQEETTFSYIRILRKAGLIDETMEAPSAWSIWQLVNEDSVIVQKKAKLEKFHQRTGYLSRYLETATVLNQMTEVERLRLKYRVICKPEKFF